MGMENTKKIVPLRVVLNLDDDATKEFLLIEPLKLTVSRNTTLLWEKVKWKSDDFVVSTSHKKDEFSSRLGVESSDYLDRPPSLYCVRASSKPRGDF
jgi:hypothetical protein